MQVETLGTVVDVEERAGVNGALIELDDDGHQVLGSAFRFLMTAGRH